MKRIMFISPYAGRAGAEIYLYRFLKNYDARQFQVMVVTEKYSPLFASLEPKILYTHMKKRSLLAETKKALRLISSKLKNRDKPHSFGLFIEEVHRQFQPDEWVLNSILMQKVMPSVLCMKVDATLIVHEMPSAYSFISIQSMQTMLTHCKRIITNSSSAGNAISIMGRSDVKIQPCFYDADEIKLRQPRSKIRSDLKIDPGDFVLIGAGSLDFNKGVELFMQISEISVGRPWKFVWVGGQRKTGFNYYLDRFYEKLKENGNLIILSEKNEDYYEYLNICDAFLLTSFNESFSLVTLEALALGKPAVVYNCGGVIDFMTEQYGRVVDSRDPSVWLETIDWLVKNYEQFPAQDLKSLAVRYSTTSQVPALTALLSDQEYGVVT
ncbi:glycosyltransferase [Ketobacter sp. MCCC 1A13808]|uniref:glycosyltransferase family 4 protein n=1 Tax=Ketobacter sp. MCCC 1A13808 TaxID=2602738 RepID=UPI0012EBEF54|nr:glycosyltransferase [Ketobacter sp. MCCC 1A13808]MVF13783.1 glycosyltransferase [Ketobacter sp. MCCC 1A13808]